VDNASDDDTCAIVERQRRSMPCLRLVRNERDLGPGASRNIGLGLASGEWRALLDADDWFAPTRLERLIARAEQVGASIIADNQILTTASGTPIRPLFQPETPIEQIGLEAFLRRDRFVRIGTLGTLKPVFRATFLDATRVKYDTDPGLRVGEDALFYLSCLLAGAFIYLWAEPLYFYRQHSDSLSRSVDARALHVAREKTSELLVDARRTASPTLAALIDQRIADIDAMIAYREMICAMKDARWADAAVCFIRNWQRSAFLLHRAGMSCLRIFYAAAREISAERRPSRPLQ